MSATRKQVRLRPVIRVFVSSTFSDMKHERNALEADAFPKLEQLCQRHGFQFQAIDLRWGVSTEAGLDHRTIRICFDELRRAQELSPRPNFLILLGNRYGWRPLPEEISVEEFHTLEHAAVQIPGSADKPAVAVLREWYHEDTNAVPPVYLLQSRRQDLGDDQDYTRDAVWNQVQAVLWTIINRAMPPEQLQRRFDVMASDGSPPAIVRFQASATEQEIWHGALRVPDAREHVLAFFREIENLAAFPDPKQIKDFVDVDPSGSVEVALQTEQDRLKAELRQRLGSANVIRNETPARLVEAQDNQGDRTRDVTTDHLAQLCADVVSRMSEIIQGQIEEYWRNTAQASLGRAARELEIEQCEYERFAQERGGEESFVGRQVELQAILDYVGSNSPWPLVIHGASGCGKTALLARASQEVAKTRKGIERFIGVAPRSSDLRSLLSSLCQELRQRNPRADAHPTEIKELRHEFSQHLQAATPEQPLILFLDALDQLADADNGRLLNWLPPGSLPAHVKLVVSCLSDRATVDPAGQPYSEFKRRQIPAENFINLDVLSEAEARLLLFDRWLPKAGRKVSDDQLARIEQRLASPACRQPIFLKLLFEEVQLWHSYDPAPVPGESVPALLGQLFDRLCQPTNHGPLLVNRVLGYLSASRHGLAENEILEILFADPEYRAELNEATEQTRHELPPNAKRIPIALWSRLRFDLAPYLTERAAPGANVLTFYHRQVSEWVQDHFGSPSGRRLARHQKLAAYFNAQDYFLESVEEQRARAKRLPPTPRPANVRKAVEMPWQRIESAKLAREWDEVERLLTDVFFLAAKAEAGLVFDLAADFTQAVAAMPVERPQHRIMRLLEQAIRRDIHFISRYPTTLFQCLWNRCWWYDCSEAAHHYDPPEGGWGPEGPPWERQEPKLCQLLESWRAETEMRQPGLMWLRSLRPPPFALGGAEAVFLRGHTAGVFDVGWDAEGGHVLSGAGDQTVRLWDANTGQELACFSGHKAWVSSVLWDAAAQRIISGSGDQTVRVWDVREARELLCISGHRDLVSSLAWDAIARRIISGSSDCTVRVWDAATGDALACLRGHSDGVACVAWDPIRRRIASGSYDGTIRVWDAETSLELSCLRGHAGTVKAVAWDPAGGRLASGGDCTVRVWSSETCQELLCLRGHEWGVTSVAWDAAGGRIISGSHDGTVRLWDADTARELTCLRGHGRGVNAVSWEALSRQIVSGSDDGNVVVWQFDETPKTPRLRGHGWGVTTVILDPTGQRIASGADDGTVRVWDAHTGVELACLRGDQEDIVTALAWEPAGKRIAASFYVRRLRAWDYICVWDIGTSERLACLRERHIHSLVWEGARLVLRSGERTLKTWAPGTGERPEVIVDTGLTADISPPSEVMSSRAISGGLETRIERGNTAVEVAWWPMALTAITARRDDRAWAGANSSYLAIFALEGGP